MSTQQALQDIYDKHQDLTPNLVVEVASDPNHELHKRFEWDDSEAGRKYRLVQAQSLIRSVTVTIERHPESPPIRVRAFVAKRDLQQASPRSIDPELDARVSPDPAEPETVGSYQPVTQVIESDVLRTAWFRSLEREWKNLKRRAGTSKEFADMVLRDMEQDVS